MRAMMLWVIVEAAVIILALYLFGPSVFSTR